MKIFVLTTNYPKEKNPQANIFVHEQCKELQKLGHTLIVLDVYFEPVMQWISFKRKQIVKREFENISVYSLFVRGFATNKLLLFNQSNYIINAKKLYNHVVLHEDKPDVIYAHFIGCAGVFGCIIGKKENIPVVIAEHGGAVMNPLFSVYIWMNFLFVKKYAHAIICVSNAQMHCYRRYSNDLSKLHVVQNIVDNSFCYHPRTKKEQFIFFSSGNLYKVKRMDVLILAFAEAFKGESKCVLRIAGDGGQRKLLERIIKKYNLSKKVFLLGRLPRERIIQELINCDVFSLASEHESFGIAYREAIITGRPVVSTNNGGILDGWNDSYGYIVSVNDIHALSCSLRKAYDHIDQFDVQNNSTVCRLFTSPSIVMPQIEAILFSAAKMTPQTN